jgi:uncharacterized RDD family membrane protein YckC
VLEREKVVVTPEGVPIRFRIALAGDRVGALVLDLLAVVGLLLAMWAPVLYFMFRDLVPADVGFAILLLLQFLVRTFYFAWFELSWNGQTPGKRRIGIRAVDAGGGPLRAEAIVARNLTRELEIFLPVSALSAPQLLFPGAPGWAALAAAGWLILFGFLPLFNRDRLRVGDLVAGTIVVRDPEPALLEDLSARAAEEWTFPPEQLEIYGVYELQVLEDVLRSSGADRAARLHTVAAAIARKLELPAPPDDERFLSAFYAALRGRLEGKLLLGKRKADKHDRVA